MKPYVWILLKKYRFSGVVYGWICLMIVGVCNFFYSLFKLSSKIENVNKILLINLNQIGDLIVSTPAIYLLTKMFPNAEISVLTTTSGKTALDGHPSIKEIMLFDDNEIRKYLRVIKLIHRNKPDLVIDFQVTLLSFKKILFSYLSGARFRIAFKRKGFRNFLPTKEFEFPMYKYMADCYADLVSSLKNSEDFKADIKRLNYYLPIKQSDLDWFEELSRKHNIQKDNLLVAIHPCTKNKLHRWSAQGFADVANHLTNIYNSKILITGREDEMNIIAEIIPKLKKPPILIVQKEFSKFCTVVKYADLLVSIDTSAVHIATAASTPFVAIYGPTISEYWAPNNNPLQKVVRINKPNCAGRCRIIEPERIFPTLEVCTEAEQVCMQHITSDKIIRTVEYVLERLRDAKLKA